MGFLLDSTYCRIHLHCGVTKTSKQHYLRNKSLHGYPMFSSKAKIIQVGNGEGFNILLIIAIIIVTIENHMFEIFTMVFEMCENVDLVLDVKMFV